MPELEEPGWMRRLGLGRRSRLELARERGRSRLAGAWMASWAAVLRRRDLARKREESKKQKQADQVVAWRMFMETERREIGLRRDGQLVEELGEPLPGEVAAMMQQLISHDKTQAGRGLVALMSGGNTTYKALDDLSPEDMPARMAANRLRTTWLKERRDGWLGRGETPA